MALSYIGLLIIIILVIIFGKKIKDDEELEGYYIDDKGIKVLTKKKR